VAYQTAWLKFYYPTEYMAALMTSVLDMSTKVADYILTAKGCGIGMLPPDINESEVDFTVSADGNIRYGLLALKNVGVNFVSAACEERKKRKFSSFEDFLYRMSSHDTNKKQIESLIKAGSFDSLGVSRSTLLASYDEMLDLLSRQRHTNLEGQIDMFSASDSDSAFEYEYKIMPELDLKVKLMYEKEVMDMYVSAHPLDAYADILARSSGVPIAEVVDPDRDLLKYPDKGTVTVSGMIVSVSRKSKNSGDMAFVTLEDKTASVEVIVFSRVYAECARLLLKDAAISVTGEISGQDDEAPKIIAKQIVPITALASAKAKKLEKEPDADEKESNGTLYLRVEDISAPAWKRANAIINIFSGKTPVIVYETTKGKYSALTNKTVSADEFVLGELREILGENNVIIK